MKKGQSYSLLLFLFVGYNKGCLGYSWWNKGHDMGSWRIKPVWAMCNVPTYCAISLAQSYFFKGFCQMLCANKIAFMQSTQNGKIKNTPYRSTTNLD